MNLLDRILGSTGQERTAALRDLGRRAEYYVPPELRGILGFAAEMTPSETLNRAAVAGGEMLAPGRTPMQRVGSAGRMLSETAGVAAPIAAGPRAGMTAAQSLQEGLLGFSMAADDAGRRFVERMNQPGPVPTMYSNPVGRGAGDAPIGIRAFHGSPHDFDRFSMSKIGTGEGAQAYGHGLYFAEAEPVARGYRDALSSRAAPGDAQGNAYDLVQRMGGDEEWTAETLRDAIENVVSPNTKQFLEDTLKHVENKTYAGYTPPTGRMYDVNIKANPKDFLDWDKPLANSPAMKKAILNAIEQARLSGGGEGFDRGLDLFERDIDGYTQGLAYRRLGDILDPVTGKEDVAASEALRGQGVAGIRYLDAMSRGAGEGSRNYVVFDENLIEIVRKYGIAGAALMLGMSQADLAQAMQAQQQQKPQGLLGGPQ